MFEVSPLGLKEIMRACVLARESLIVKGEPGVGKTGIAVQISEELGYETIIMYPAISSRTDFVGQPVYDRDSKKAMFVPYDKLNDMITADKPTVVILDDFGQAPVSIQTGCMHLLGERRIGFNKISDHVTFLILTNDRGQQAGVNGIIEPAKTRPIAIIELQTNLDDWITDYANKNNIREEVVAFLRMKPEMLNDFNPTTELTNSPSPRTNEHVSKILNMNLSEDLEFSMVAGAAGSGYATMFMPFKKIFKSMLPPSAILRDPEGFELDLERPDLLFAYETAVSRLANRENISQIIKFAKRLPPEYGYKMMEYDIHGKESLKETKEYIAWAVDNQDMFRYED